MIIVVEKIPNMKLLVTSLCMLVIQLARVSSSSDEDLEAVNLLVEQEQEKRGVWPHFIAEHNGIAAEHWLEKCKAKTDCPKGYVRQNIVMANMDQYTIDVSKPIDKTRPKPEGWRLVDGAGDVMVSMKEYDSPKITITNKKGTFAVRETCIYCFGVKNVIFEYFRVKGGSVVHTVQPQVNIKWFMFNCLNNGWMKVNKIEMRFDNSPPTFHCKHMYTEACVAKPKKKKNRN